ncbi:MAG: hypothetical protein EAS51_00045 [Microbacteriaceae bacterium]|nr:MAG: hypothetical protein EAS51_00045 [Microbacteriaceae bacterium]
MSMWRDGAVSIVLFSTREQADQTLELVRDWTKHGLLSPAAWVYPDQIVRGDGPPQVRATLIDADGEGELIEAETDLFEMLATEAISRVRLVKLRSSARNSSADGLQDDASDLVARYVAHSMPQLHPSASGATESVELVRTSLICTPTQVQLDERLRGAERDSSVVVVASPEDRATPAAGDAFVRENDRFDGFVLMHLATLAGLWRGTPVGTLELFERESSAAQSIWIQRVFVRGVLTRGISRRAAAEVLSRLVEHRGAIAATGVNVTPDGTSAIPADRIPMYVDRMVEAAVSLDDSALAYRPPQLDRAPERDQIGVWKQLGLFFRFAGGKLARVPHWMILWFHDLFARGVARELQGAEGRREIALLLDQRPDAMDRRLLYTVERLQQPITAVERMAATVSPSDHVAPRLWVGLRKLMFSAVDGSAGLGETFAPIDGRVPVFDSLDPIAPDPRGGWEHPDPPKGFPSRVTWAQVRDDPSLREKLVAVVDAAGAARAEAAAQYAEAAAAANELKGEVSALEERLLGEGVLKVRSDGRIMAGKPVKNASDEAVEAHRSAVAGWQALKSRLRAVEGDQDDAGSRVLAETSRFEQASVHLAAFDEWTAEQRSTFAVRLEDRMSAARETAERELEEAEKAGADVPKLRELVRLRKAFHRGLLIAFLVIAAIAGASIALPWYLEMQAERVSSGLGAVVEDLIERGEYPEWWVIVLYGVGLLAVVTLLLLVSYYRGWSTFARRVQLAEFHVETRALRARALQAEVSRLASIHDQTRQWVDLVAAALYDPWEIPQSWKEVDATALDAQRMPFAMAIGEAVEGSGTGADRITRDAASEMLRKGWRDAAFRELLAEVGRRLGLDESRLGLEALDSDLPEAPNNSRSLVRRYMSESDVLQSVAEQELSRIADGVQTDLQSGERIMVRPIPRADAISAFRKRRGDVETRGWSDFLLEPVTSSPHNPTPLSALGIASHQIQRAHHEGVASYVVGPQSVIEAIPAAMRESLVLRTTGLDSSEGFDALLRVDIVGPVPLDAVHALAGGRTSARQEPIESDRSGI